MPPGTDSITAYCLDQYEFAASYCADQLESGYFDQGHQRVLLIFPSGGRLGDPKFTAPNENAIRLSEVGRNVLLWTP